MDDTFTSNFTVSFCIAALGNFNGIHLHVLTTGITKYNQLGIRCFILAPLGAKMLPTNSFVHNWYVYNRYLFLQTYVRLSRYACAQVVNVLFQIALSFVSTVRPKTETRKLEKQEC